MAKTANLYARIEPEVKKNAEIILDTLGIPVSNAINMFYKQIILQRGIPFDLKVPVAKPPSMRSLTEEQLDEEFEKGFSDMLEGRVKLASMAFADIRKDYDV